MLISEKGKKEKKSAITELSILGEIAIPSLKEIMNVTAYEEIKAACIEAIKAAKAQVKPKDEVQEEKVIRKTASISDLPP